MQKNKTSVRAQRRAAERAAKKNVLNDLTQNTTKKIKVINWQDYVKQSKINLIKVFEENSSEILKHIEERIFVDIQNQPKNGLSFNYKELDIHKFLDRQNFDSDFALTASMNYYNACIIESRDFDNLISMMAMAVMASINEQTDQLTQIDSMKKLMESSNFKIIEVNDSYLKIKPDLIKRRWINEESNFCNSFSIGNDIIIESTPALRLVNDIFNITIKPHLNGIEISRLEVYEKYQGKHYASRFLDNILLYLIQIGINEIYVMPFPSGYRTKKGISGDLKLLESFFYKRGFRKLIGQPYWQLKDMSYLDTITEIAIDYSLLEN